MNPGSTSTFYAARRWLAGAIIVGVIAAAAALWWAIDRLVLTPPTPGPSAAATAWLDYTVSPRGLARLAPDAAVPVLESLLVRVLSDTPFRESFAAELRRASTEDQAAFREHVFDAFKPRLMADVRRYHDLEGDARDAFLDDRLIYFKRMELLSRGSKLDKSSIGDAAGEQAALIKLLLEKTTEEERSLGAAYIRAAALHWNEIRQDPDRLAAFEARLKTR